MLPFSKELPYGPLWADGQTVLLHDPPARLRGLPPSRFALGALWQVTPVAVELMAASQLSSLAARLLEPLLSAPVGSVLAAHWLITRGHGITPWEAQLGPETSAWEQAKLEALRQGLPHHVRDRLHTLAATHTLLSLRVPVPHGKPEHLAEALAASYPAFSALCQHLEQAYGGLGMRPIRLSEGEVARALARYLHPTAQTPVVFDAGLPLARQIVRASPTLGPKGVCMGHDMQASVLSAIRYPPTLTVGALSSPRAERPGAHLLEPWTWSTQPVALSVAAAVLDPERLLDQVAAKQAFSLVQRDQRQQDEVTDASVAREDFAQAKADLLRHVPYVGLSTQLVLWHAPNQGLDLCLKAQLAAREIGLALHVEEMMAGELFLRSLPLAYDPDFPPERDMRRSEPVRSVYAGALLPFYGGYAGARRTHSSYVVNHRDEGITLDLFDAQPPHTLIVGRTRTGKSITTNWLMSDILARGGTVFILDRYGSYHGLAALYGGVVKRVSPTEPVCFGLMDGPLDADHRSAVVGVIAELFVAQGDPPLGATDIAYLTALVQGFGQHWHVERAGTTATLSDFLDHLEALQPAGGAGRFARRLGVVLSLYAGTGEYAAFLDGPNELVMGHGLSILDIDGLDDVSWLQTIITLLFFHRAEAYIQDPTHLGRRKLLVSDECWGMLKSAQAAEAINKYVRAYARFNAALVMITQNMTDLESLVGRVLINNSGRALMFKLLSDEARYVCNQLGMPAHMVEVIAALVGPDEYQHADMAEGIVCRPNDASGDGGLFRLVAPQAWLARVGQSRQHQGAS